MLQPVFGHISDSVAYFISPISTGLDRKTRPGPHTTLPCEGGPRGTHGWRGWTCIPRLPRGAVAYLFRAGSAQTVLLNGQCGRQISLCPHYRLNSQPRKCQGGEEKQGVSRRSAKGRCAKTQRRAGARRKTLIVAGVCEVEGAGWRRRGRGVGISDRRAGSTAPLENLLYSLICETTLCNCWQRSEQWCNH